MAVVEAAEDRGARGTGGFFSGGAGAGAAVEDLMGRPPVEL